MGFIEDIAPLVQKHIAEYGIKIASPIIAQAVLESNHGLSSKAQYHNYFGLKYRANRVDCNSGIFYDGGSEQNKDGSYTNLSNKTAWYSFSNMENGVLGYLQFINTSNYKNLKGVTDPKQYLELIKQAGYATSLKYVDNLMAVIDKYNLTKYDDIKIEESGKMIINIHGGHNPDGKIACGAIGLIKESIEARKVKDLVMTKLRALGHTVYDCTVDNGTSQNDVLRKIIAKCNAHKVDLDISIHFNAGANDRKGNGKSTGTEVLVYNAKSKALPYAQKICGKICELGFKNRGVKYNTGLYFLRKTKAPSCLIEVAFVDDADDCKLYNVEKVANKIVEGITGKSQTSIPSVVVESAKEEPVKTTLSGQKLINYNLQVWINEYLGGKYLVTDGLFGKQSKKYLNMCLEKALGLAMNGSLSSVELNRITYSKIKNSKDLTKVLEAYLYARGFNPQEFSGKYTDGVKLAVKEFQRTVFTLAKDIDGLAGVGTFRKLVF